VSIGGTGEQTTPVIVGIGECRDLVPGDFTAASSLVDMLVRAGKMALDDSNFQPQLRRHIDTVMMTRTFADSSPMWPAPFGKVRNYPRAVAAKLGVRPRQAIYSEAGGDVPQKLLSEAADTICQGKSVATLILGGEAIATVNSAMRAGVALDWTDDTDGQLEDRGVGTSGIQDQAQIDHGLTGAPPVYALFENARRARLGLDRSDYATAMGELFSPFSKVAARHPCSMFSQYYTAEELLAVSQDNRIIAEPYTKSLVAKDGVNQAAALLVTSLAVARDIGIDKDKFVFPLASCALKEKPLLARPQLDRSAAMSAAYHVAMDRAGVNLDEIDLFDIYSCFPIAVFAVCDALGLSPQDPRGLTLTGGLPFFGGPGNNYALHSIVNVARELRNRKSGHGLVGANGGYLSKHAVGVYSATQPRARWRQYDDHATQLALDQTKAPTVDTSPQGPAKIETYTVVFSKGQADQGYVVGVSDAGKRFLATTDPSDKKTPHEMMTKDPLHRRIWVTHSPSGNHFRFDKLMRTAR
jgi:acetyl-CoA C-acetyltransferase